MDDQSELRQAIDDAIRRVEAALERKHDRTGEDANEALARDTDTHTDADGPR